MALEKRVQGVHVAHGDFIRRNLNPQEPSIEMEQECENVRRSSLTPHRVDREWAEA